VTAARTEDEAKDGADDARLLSRMARGENEALAELYDRHAGLLYGLLLKLLRDAKDAEDALQDVFLGAWQDAARFDPERGSGVAWLVMRARSGALDRLRRAGVRRAEALPDADALPALERQSPEERLAVRAALAELPEDVGTVLLQTYFLGRTAREIAAELGVPEGTVRSRLARGLAILAVGLDER
jgi:RNA polymerase sigma-70 factor, ECF subfamily